MSLSQKTSRWKLPQHEKNHCHTKNDKQIETECPPKEQPFRFFLCYSSFFFWRWYFTLFILGFGGGGGGSGRCVRRGGVHCFTLLCSIWRKRRESRRAKGKGEEEKWSEATYSHVPLASIEQLALSPLSTQLV